jgi:Holliday junction DNA helicase RuvA
MIGFVRGMVATCVDGVVTVDVGGVGYQVFVPTSFSAQLSQESGEILIHTYQYVRESEISLYGFETVAQRELFKALLDVSGVGPKVALAALSSFSPETLSRAIATDDLATITSIPGVGKKTAQRIIIDLKGKIDSSLEVFLPSSRQHEIPAISDTHAALEGMGFSSMEIAVALKGIDESQDTPMIIAQALRNLGGVRA